MLAVMGKKSCLFFSFTVENSISAENSIIYDLIHVDESILSNSVRMFDKIMDVDLLPSSDDEERNC